MNYIMGAVSAFGVFSVAMALVISAGNFQSKIVFKVLPFFGGAICIVAGAKYFMWF